jgi:uncharacterized protein YndB with AHSA1/START domain
MSAEATTEIIERSITVTKPPEEAFRLFTDGISTWWPFLTHSIGGEKTNAAVFEGEGGRLYERQEDGTECDWADVVAFEPPERIVLSWRVDPSCAATEVEIRFAPDGDGTRVDLEHRGWENVEAGGTTRRENYASGWARVLSVFEEAAGR